MKTAPLPGLESGILPDLRKGDLSGGLFEHRAQGLDLGRLDEVRVEPGLASPTPIVVLTPGGKRVLFIRGVGTLILSAPLPGGGS